MQETHKHTYTLTAGQTNAEGRISPTVLARRIIEVATEHANILGIGYDAMMPLGIGWVLSRLTIEMVQEPQINHDYTLTTWIEDINRMFSNRNMRIDDADGRLLGRVRTKWALINYTTRTGVDISVMDTSRFPVVQQDLGLEMPGRIRPVRGEGVQERGYRFEYTDIDFNRHVTTTRYIDLILNCHPLSWHDAHRPRLVDFTFHHECREGMGVQIRFMPLDEEGLDCVYEIVTDDGVRCLAAHIMWERVGA